MEKVKGAKPSVSIKDQGGPKPYGAGKSRGGGAALRGTKFSGIC